MSDAITDILAVLRETFPGDNQAWLLSDLSDADYHGNEGLSSSDVKKLAKNPQAWRYMKEHGHVDTPQLAFGRAFHCMGLEPTEYDKRYVTVKSTTRTTKAFKDAVKANPDRQVMLESETNRARAMAIACRSSEQIDYSELVGTARIEHSGYWFEGDLLCKFRPDIMTDTCIYDLKSTTDASPEGFQRSVIRYGYHTSAAWYLRGANKVLGNANRRFLWIAVEKDAPHAVQVYEATSELLALGQRECQRGIANYRKCTEADTYPAYATEVLPMSVPAYLLSVTED